ncbi:MAG: beta-N-acetylhexosaminidase [Clostridiales bacterium]|nr:beta-N-acetylhexosaminidase [Clostridiales bacterium]
MINLIPKPYYFKEKKGFYSVPENAKIYTEIELPLVKNIGGEDSEIKIFSDSSLERESYSLKVDKDGISVRASEKAGAYYALQTLRMIGRFDEGERNVPLVEINDKPKYSWRGLSLDEARHFFGKENVKKYIDELFRLKLNVFHWHLTDDQGWRIEIKKYPLLTEIGSKRSYTHLGGWGCCDVEKKEYSGFYTQEDIKEIVAYAAERCVSVLPEIDVPAHFAAALAAYPQLACRNLKREVPGCMGDILFKKQHIKDWNRPACMGKKESINFIFDVYDEVCSLFPFEYFHVGGDEVLDMNEWKNCPDCQKVMRENGFKTEFQLQQKLENDLCAFLKKKGKHMLAWNDILKEGCESIDSDVLVQQWLPGQDKNTVEFAEKGGNVLMSNHKSFYFDMTYSQYPLKNTYTFSPKQYGIKNEKSIVGVEGEVWTEWIRNFDKVEFMTHPRMEALSEVAWTEEADRNFKEFYARYKKYKSVYNYIGVNYAENKICMPKNAIKRAKVVSKFHKGNPDYEYCENKNLKEHKI